MQPPSCRENFLRLLESCWETSNQIFTEKGLMGVDCEASATVSMPLDKIQGGSSNNMRTCKAELHFGVRIRTHQVSAIF